jgi:hypothetical protein
MTVIYRYVINNVEMEKLQKKLDVLGERAVENEMKINPRKIVAILFTRATVQHLLNYSLMDTLKREESSCKYLGIIFRSDLNWEDKSNYSAEKKRKHCISQCE